MYVYVEDYKRFLTAWMKRLTFHCTFGIVSIFASYLYNLFKNYKLRKFLRWYIGIFLFPDIKMSLLDSGLHYT